MIKAVLIDDEPLARSIVKEYLKNYPQICVAEECDNGFEGVKSIMLHQPDIIFLDIQMPRINGFEMLELIENPPAVIFTTAYDEFAIKAFDTHAIDYLLKPFNRERFDRAVQKYLSSQPIKSSANTSALLELTSQSPAQNNRVVVKIAGKIKIIPVHEIVYLESADDFVKVYTREGCFLKNKTMSHFEKVLDPQLFVRTHRSYMVSIQEITRIDPYEKENHIALLKSGVKIPVSKTGYARLKNVLGL